MQTKWTLMGFIVLMFATTAVIAQTTTSPTLSTDQRQSQQTAGVDLCRGSSIIGAKVINAQGEDLGKIHEIVLNQQRDQVGYAVLAHGGVAGVGEKMIAIPWSEFQVQSATTAGQSGQSSGAYGTQNTMTERSGLSGAGQSPGAQVGDRSSQYDTQRGQTGSQQQYGQSAQQHRSQRLAWNRDMDVQVTLPVSKDSLDRVQGFSRDAWPDQASANWQQQTTAQQQKLSDAQQSQFDTRKLSKIIGMKVESTTPITFRETSSASQQQDARQEQGRSAAQERSGRTEIGKIKDCVLNSDNGRLIYGVVSLSEISGHTRDMSVVPWEAIRVDQQQQICLLQVTSGDSLLAFTFQSNQQPDLADRNYLERVYTAFNVEPQWEALGFVPPSGSESGRPGMQQQRRDQQQQQMQRQQQQQQQPRRGSQWPDQ